MAIIADYHTHTKLCNHAFGMPIDYVKEAIKLGMKGIGISDHNPVPAFLYPETSRTATIKGQIWNFPHIFLLDIMRLAVVASVVTTSR